MICHEPVSPQSARQLSLLFALTTENTNFTKCCLCHDKWHCNITRYCTCHEKWPAPNVAPATAKTEGGAAASLPPATKSDLHQILHLPQRKLSVELDCNFTKYCTCHEKWQLDCTKYCTCPDESWVLIATSPNIGPATKSDSWTAPNTVPLYYSLTRAILFSTLWP